MKVFFTSLVILAVMVQTFDRFGIILSYEINKAFIIENFCINKSKPQMHCNGKCHLKKELNQNEEKKNETPINQKKNEIVLDQGNQRLAVVVPKINFKKMINRDWSTNYSCLHQPPFRPPKAFANSI